jgi:hypothetical protein
MPFSANDIIGKKLFAKQPVKVLRSNLQETGSIIQSGNLIGTVWSYIQRGNSIYWIMNTQNGFLIKHDFSKLQLDPTQRKELEIEQRKEIEDQQKKDKGVIPFYIEKYGKIALVSVLAITVLKTYLKR